MIIEPNGGKTNPNPSTLNPTNLIGNRTKPLIEWEEFTYVHLLEFLLDTCLSYPLFLAQENRENLI